MTNDVTFTAALEVVFERIGSDYEESWRLNDSGACKRLNELVVALENVYPAKMAELSQKSRKPLCPSS